MIFLAVQKVALITPEYYGRVQVGGLGMAVHGLAHALKEKGLNVRVITPSYGQPPAGNKSENPIALRDSQTTYNVWTSEDDGIVLNEIEGISLGHLYDLKTWGSAQRREAGVASLAARNFSRVAAEVLAREPDGLALDVLHLHEWHSASAAVDTQRNMHLRTVPVVTTTHNAHYIGRVPQNYPDMSEV